MPSPASKWLADSAGQPPLVHHHFTSETTHPSSMCALFSMRGKVDVLKGEI